MRMTTGRPIFTHIPRRCIMTTVRLVRDTRTALVATSHGLSHRDEYILTAKIWIINFAIFAIVILLGFLF